MRLTTLGLTIGLALAAIAPGAEAADWNSGGSSIKDRGGVPIPAPMPIPETFKWYLRADVGGGMISGGDPSPRGNVYGFDRDPLDGQPFGISSAWFNNGFDTFAVGGFGAGAYIGPRIRSDVTIDARTKSNVDMDGSYRYLADPTLYGGQILRVDGVTQERVEVRDTAALLNFYVDLAERGSRLVPYIGAGVGFAVRTVDRRHATTETVTDITDPLNPVVVGLTQFTPKIKSHQFVPAAAAHAGVAYTLDSGMVLDFSYRFAYISSAEANMQINGGSGRLTIGDTTEHALRAGVRWNVW